MGPQIVFCLILTGHCTFYSIFISFNLENNKSVVFWLVLSIWGQQCRKHHILLFLRKISISFMNLQYKRACCWLLGPHVKMLCCFKDPWRDSIFPSRVNLRRHASRASATNDRSHRKIWKVRWILLSWENWVCFIRTESFSSLGGNKRLLRCDCKQSVIKMKCEVRDTWCECDTCVPVMGWLLRHICSPVGRCVQA